MRTQPCGICLITAVSCARTLTVLRTPFASAITQTPVCSQPSNICLDRFKARWPNKKILISTGTLSYMTPSQQLPWMKDVLSHADGYFSESLTNDHSYWNNQPNS